MISSRPPGATARTTHGPRYGPQHLRTRERGRRMKEQGADQIDSAFGKVLARSCRWDSMRFETPAASQPDSIVSPGAAQIERGTSREGLGTADEGAARSSVRWSWGGSIVLLPEPLAGTAAAFAVNLTVHRRPTFIAWLLRRFG